jgi:hypothetical protein
VVRLILLAALAFVALACGRVDATLCTIPNVFSTGTVINAAPFNANFSALQTCGNNIDNSNIGSSGLYASQLIPTTGAQASFGGSQNYTFPAGLFINGPASVTTYIVAGSATAPAVSAGDVAASRSTTTGALLLGGTGSSATLDYGVTTGGVATLNKPLSVTGAFTASNGTFAGPVKGAVSGSSGSTPIVFNGSGVDPCGGCNTIHVVLLPAQSVSVTSGNGFSNVDSVTLSGNATFSGSTDYIVTATPDTQITGWTNGAPIPIVTSKTATSFNVTFYAATGTASSTQSLTFDLYAIGF